MLRQIYLIKLLVSAVLCLMLSHKSIAQTVKNIPNAQAIVQVASIAALDSAARGNTAYAIKLLNATLKDLPPEKENNTYRAYVHFNLGYIYRNYGSDVETDYLSLSVKHYETALSYQPNDQKILSNLVLVLQQKGDDTTAVDYLKQAIKKDPAREGIYYAALGDLYSTRGLNDQAWEYYRKATTANQPDEEAGRKLIELYNEFPMTVVDRLYAQCKEFDDRNAHTLARLGYGKILANYFSAYSTLGIVDGSLLRWAAISSELGFVTPQIFYDAGLENCEYPPVKELSLYLTAWQRGQFPTAVDANMNWWQRDARYQFHLLAFEKSFGDYVMRNGNPKLAVVIYEDVLDQLWQRTDYSSEIYGSPDVLITDVLIALARTYNHPKLKMEDSWKQLESRLVDMKGQAYTSNDLASRQKFHTILGQIYFDRGEFTGFGFKNAEFQLKNAIEVAERRASKDPATYYPLPNLQQKLGAVYLADGRNADAADAFMQAAIGYLETDHLRKCDEILKQVSDIPVVNTSASHPKFKMIQAIYTIRAQIPGLSKEQFDPKRQEYFQNHETFKWLFDKSRNDNISEDILIRQRFKVLSDLSERAAAVGASEASVKLSNEARTEMKDVKVLSSQQDLIRMQHLEVTSKQFNDLPDNTPKASWKSPGANEKLYHLATPPGEPKQEVIIQKQSLKKKKVKKHNP